MRAIVIFASLMAVALARPDVSHLAQTQGYQYNSPNSGSSSSGSGAIAGPSKGGYSGGNNQFAGSSNNFNTQAYQGSSVPSTSGFSSGQPSGGYSGNAQQQQQFGGFQSGSGGSGGFQSGSSSGSSGFGGQSSGGFGGQSSGQSYSGSGGFTSGGGFSSGGTNLVQGQSQSIDLTGGSSGGDRVVYKPVIKQGEPIITKNFYVHAAPEEDENVRVEEKVQVVRPQKSYKIIFIKAPSSGSSFNAANYPVFPQNEEKTIVYVLSKKDDFAGGDFGEIPTPPPAVTHKPEVYFIKYKTKQEAAAAVANIQAQYKGEGTSGDFGATGSDSGFTSSGSSNGFAGSSSSGSNGYAGTGSGSSFGGTGSGSGYSSSSGSGFGTGGTSDLSLQNFRGENNDEDSNVDIASFLPNANGNNGQSSGFSSSSGSQSAFGPSGGQISLQSSASGPSGGSSVEHSHQTDSSGQITSQSTNFANGNEIVPQNIVRVDDESAFAGIQSYLPPN
ncbi:hypothetical protein PVAND_013821 [Polypedilum vanderplanki]|uniref:DUF243 domain-containing protein n=1 Tax=Polypedilum vanderplanki TaxID=319348 RepID=A0A9J6CRS5_POLVA|nr:hypothetical protein PVAND_013821 [Polypedilum vanderplanki]